jgi:hypothetical protein
MKFSLYLLAPIFLAACAAGDNGSQPPTTDIVFHRECEGVPFARFREQSVNLTYDQAIKKNLEVAAGLKARAEITDDIDADGDIGAKAGNSTDSTIKGSATYKTIISAEEAEVRSAFQDSICTSIALLDRSNISEESRLELERSIIKAINERNGWISRPKE